MNLKRVSIITVALAVALVAVFQGSPAQALVYNGDWRMTVHQQTGDQCQPECQLTFDIRTNQPEWQGSDQYEASGTLNGVDMPYGDVGAGQTEFGEVDPDFAGVRVAVDAGTRPSGDYTFVLDWFYRGVWTCGPQVPEGCAYVGRERVQKTYKFHWNGPDTDDKTVRPFLLPGSTASIGARRSGATTTVSGTVKTQRLNSNFVRSKTFYKAKGARATLQSYSPSKKKWISRKTVTSNRNGAISAKLSAAKGLKWRWLVLRTKTYSGSVSKVLKK